MNERARERRVLVVEDNLKNLKLVTDLLEHRGHAVITAQDGLAGVEKALHEIPDLVLMDLQLPGLDGLEATRRIKENEKTAKVPVLAVTAHALREDCRRIRQAGCDGYVTKPIRTRDFLRVVEEALQVRVAEKPPREAPKERARAPREGGAGTVLVVDDEERNRRLIEATLSPLGFRTVHAASGEEALALFEDDLPDLVLLDIMMPGLDGIETTRRIRAANRTRHLPVILLTAFADFDRKIQGIEAGCDDFIAKPFDRLELIARIRSLIRVSFYRTQVANSRKFDILFHETTDGVVLMDAEWRIEAANENAIRFLELPSPPPPGFDIVSHLYATRKISIERPTLTSGEGGDLRFEIRRPETEETDPLVLETGVRRIQGPGGKTAAMVLTAKNVTDRWAENRLKEDFLSSVSHKLKTPLSVIMANNEALIKEYYGPVTAEMREAIQDMTTASQDLLGHVNKLLAFVSPDSVQAGAPTCERVLLLLRSYVERLRIQYESSGVRFELDVDKKAEELAVPHQSVTSVLDNLVENSVKFSADEGARVVISAGRISDGWVELAVTDNGSGIPAEECDRIFEKFYQVEKFHTGRVSGAGLGLSLAKRVVESLGGTIRVRSTHGNGSTFSFTVPATAPKDTA